MNRGKSGRWGFSVNWIAKLNGRENLGWGKQKKNMFSFLFYDGFISIGVIMPLDSGGFTIHDTFVIFLFS